RQGDPVPVGDGARGTRAASPSNVNALESTIRSAVRARSYSCNHRGISLVDTCEKIYATPYADLRIVGSGEHYAGVSLAAVEAHGARRGQVGENEPNAQCDWRGCVAVRPGKRWGGSGPASARNRAEWTHHRPKRPVVERLNCGRGKRRHQ